MTNKEIYQHIQMVTGVLKQRQNVIIDDHREGYIVSMHGNNITKGYYRIQLTQGLVKSYQELPVIFIPFIEAKNRLQLID